MNESDSTPTYGYLTAPEVRFLGAAVERLIPTDALGPGARDAGVTVFIDRQLCSPWGVHGRNYRSGPWREGTPQQGFQSPLTPQEIYRTGIRETDVLCRERHGRPFDQFAIEQQELLLGELEQGAIELPSVASKLFFDLLWRNTEEGFFADPMHGGNRDKVGWKLIGFPGVPGSAYLEHFSNPEPYHAEPVSLLDVASGRARLDAQGFAIHLRLERGER